jgi:hypothetical protein
MTLISDSNTHLTPVLIIFERTSTGRQRASWFTAEDADDAEKAALPMGYMTLRLTDEADQQIVGSQLPRGCYTPEGGAGVPFVARERLNRVLSAIAPNLPEPLSDTRNAPTKSNVVRVRPRASVPVLIDVSSNPIPSTPSDWDEIKPGSVVLVRDKHDEAWYEAAVLNVIGDVCRLKWRDYPGYPVLTRQRHQLGLMYPGKTSKSAA